MQMSLAMLTRTTALNYHTNKYGSYERIALTTLKEYYTMMTFLRGQYMFLLNRLNISTEDEVGVDIPS